MKQNVLLSLAIVLLFAFVGAAQGNQRVVIDVSYEFHAGSAVLPAGTYEIKPDTQKSVVRLLNTKTNESIMAPVVTRIAQRPGNEALVVFDQVGTQYYLSEVHIPGIDGFHLTGAPGPHTHVSLKAKK